MADNPILAAGGIVVRGNTQPTVAVVQLRKDGDWVLPKGKLDGGEDALAAAEREVNEETGHTVTVKEFVGTLCYEVNGRSEDRAVLAHASERRTGARTDERHQAGGLAAA